MKGQCEWTCPWPASLTEIRLHENGISPCVNQDLDFENFHHAPSFLSHLNPLTRFLKAIRIESSSTGELAISRVKSSSGPSGIIISDSARLDPNVNTPDEGKGDFGLT